MTPGKVATGTGTAGTGTAGGRLLRLMPGLTLWLLAVPVLAGFAGTLAPAFGFDPLSGTGPGLAAFTTLAQWPGLRAAAWLSVTSGVGSTLLALLISLGVVATLIGRPGFATVQRLLSPLLSVPHAAAALGLAFLIAPSGWTARALSPWATGWMQPPDLLILNDPAGLALTLGLVAKETPFLLLMILAALPQTDARQRMTVAASLGYGRLAGFALTVLPALYAQLRLPVYAVLAYAMTAVEMAMILGPTLPPSLSVQVVTWATEPNLAHRGTAAAAALLQVVLVVGVLGLWRMGEMGVRRLVRHAARSGWRAARVDATLQPVLLGLALTPALALAAGLAGLSVWSVAGLWSFPDAWPEDLTLATWTRAAPGLWQASITSLTLALTATLAALVLALACLEAEHRFGLNPQAWVLWLLYLPLIVPQVAFLPGLQMLALSTGAIGGWAAVAAVHGVFVLPYVFLSVSAPYRAWDDRIAVQGAALGASAARVFWRLRLPMLLTPVLTAAAVGMAVSVGQYLPTLLIGGGRVETLTTEAVALSSGGNRRVIGAYALLQMALPAIAFGIALALPRLIYAKRRGMGVV